MMAHAQKPDLVFQRNGRVHLYRRGCQFSRLLAAEVCASAVVMLDRPCSDTVQDCWLPTPFASFPSLLLPCFAVCHQVPFPLYNTCAHLTLLQDFPNKNEHPVDVVYRNRKYFQVTKYSFNTQHRHDNV